MDANGLARCNERNDSLCFSSSSARNPLPVFVFIFSNSTGPHRQASFPPLHPSIFPLRPNCGQYLKHPPSQPSLPCPLLQDNYDCRMHDGSQEVPAGRTELHPGDRELWVEKALCAFRLPGQAEGWTSSLWDGTLSSLRKEPKDLFLTTWFVSNKSWISDFLNVVSNETDF